MNAADTDDADNANRQAGADASPQGQAMQVLLQKIYLRDASVEVPDSPRVFTREWKPEMDVDLNTHVEGLGDQAHQVTVTVTATAKLDEATAYIVEVQYGGVFTITGFDDTQRRQILGSYCPSTLFPYVREVVGDLIVRAGFPQFLLQPVNFDSLYQQHLQQQDQPPGDGQ